VAQMIEIRELIIKAQVNSPQNSNKSAKPSKPRASSHSSQLAHALKKQLEQLQER